jgi:hypothetical protein
MIMNNYFKKEPAVAYFKTISIFDLTTLITTWKNGHIACRVWMTVYYNTIPRLFLELLIGGM